MQKPVILMMLTGSSIGRLTGMSMHCCTRCAMGRLRRWTLVPGTVPGTPPGGSDHSFLRGRLRGKTANTSVIDFGVDDNIRGRKLWVCNRITGILYWANVKGFHK